jgi:hypothetical protein
MKMAINFAGVNKITITCVLYDEIYFDFSCSKNLQPTAVMSRVFFFEIIEKYPMNR